MTSPTSYFAAVWARWDHLARLRADAYAGPRIEPVDPPADVLADMFPRLARPAVEYVPPSYPFTGIDVAIEAEVLDRLAALTVKSSPMEAARTLFGGSRV